MFCGRQRALKPPISSSLTVEPQAQQTSAHTLAKKHRVSLVRERERERERENVAMVSSHKNIFRYALHTCVHHSPVDTVLADTGENFNNKDNDSLRETGKGIVLNELDQLGNITCTIGREGGREGERERESERESVR